MTKAIAIPVFAALLCALPAQDRTPADLTVDPVKGSDAAAGTADRPLQTIDAAIARLPADVREPVTIHLRPGTYGADRGLVLRRATAPGVVIALRGEGAKPADVLLDWAAGDFLITVLDGTWSLSNVQVGSRRPGQRQGVGVEGPGLAVVRDVRFRLRSESGSGLHARRCGRIHLAGRIELNEDLHDKKPEDETFSRIVAEDHGTVRFVERDGASLSIGNGSLSAWYYGCIRLGCATAKITSWTMSNTIGIGNSGRVDLHGTETHLRAGNPANALIGPEDDGHIMAEDTHLVLESMGNRAAIVLQKASTFFGTNVEFRGRFQQSVIAMSGSTFAGVVKGEVGPVEATTGAHVSIQPGSVMPKGAITARFGASVVLPDGKEIR